MKSIFVFNDDNATESIRIPNKFDLNGWNRTIECNNATYGATFNGVIRNSTGNAGIIKTGVGPLTLAGANTYTGVTTVSAGELNVTGSIGTGSAVTVSSGATISGDGTINDSLTILNGGIVNPGNSGGGTLTVGNGMVLNSTSVVNVDIGTASDAIAVTGNLTLDGTVNVDAGAGFGIGTYTIMTYSGTLTDNTLSVGTNPGTYNYSIVTGSNKVELVVSSTTKRRIIII